MLQLKDWDKAEGDQAFLSHNHTLEVLRSVDETSEVRQMYAATKNEYRTDFSIAGKKFSVSTIVYVDSSTYTYIHLPATESVLKLPMSNMTVLSNAAINRPEGRQLREREIKAALIFLRLVGAPQKVAKKGDGGITISKDEDGVYTLNYSGLRQVKREGDDSKVIDYSALK